MELSISERKAVARRLARSYRSAGRAQKSRILDEVVELTGWHRDYARAALREAALLMRMSAATIDRMNAQFTKIHPVALSRQILDLTRKLETLALAKKLTPPKPAVNSKWNRHHNPEIEI